MDGLSASQLAVIDALGLEAVEATQRESKSKLKDGLVSLEDTFAL